MTSILREEGLILILSSPSGGGKSSLSRALLSKDSNLRLSISVTTREKRPGETEGVDYFFKTLQAFQNLRDSGSLLEHTEIYGNFYGTPKEFVYGSLKNGIDILFDIDYQGMKFLKEKVFGYRIVSVFLLPPNYEILEERLQKRNRDTKENLLLRLEEAKKEIFYAKDYDYVLVNDKFDLTLKNICSIISAERSKTPGLNKLEDFLNDFSKQTFR